MGRDLELCRDFAAAWFGDQLASTSSTVSEQPPQIQRNPANMQLVLDGALAYGLLEPH